MVGGLSVRFLRVNTMIDENNLNIENITFKRKPEAVPYKKRISYKVMFITLLIKYTSLNSGCSLEKMQIISSNYCNKNEQDKFISVLRENKEKLLLKDDLLLVKATNYMYSEDLLILQKDGKYRLSKKGKIFSEYIEKQNIFIKEKEYFHRIGKALPENLINKKKFIKGR